MSQQVHREMNLLEILEGLNVEIREQELLKDYTTLKIGGMVRYMVVPEDVQTATEVVKRLRESSVDFFVLGGGSNLLVPDSGIECVVLLLRGLKNIQILGQAPSVVVYAESGVALQGLVSLAMKQGLSGLEGLVGIPGSLGGAVFGNAGAFGYEIMNVVEEIDILRKGSRMVIKKEDLSYGYRDGGLLEGDVILSTRLRLEVTEPERIKRKMIEYLNIKKQTQPLDEPSAGCVFKNPPGESAGRLIDLAGCKGLTKGDIQVSTKHANFFVNKGQGRAEDFIALMDEVRERVLRIFSIELEPEIRILTKGCTSK
ncbi:MAG: UDP-N-acetylmuramate dehydrogenase [Nitrospirae bacterium]|nr:UDP-N-acetylmuramate dehydrogenase [Nitrospirota bacterium]